MDIDMDFRDLFVSISIGSNHIYIYIYIYYGYRYRYGYRWICTTGGSFSVLKRLKINFILVLTKLNLYIY
jgi:hypothetical protein